MITRRGLLKGLLGGIGLAVLAPVTSAIPSIKPKGNQGHASREHVLHIIDEVLMYDPVILVALTVPKGVKVMYPGQVRYEGWLAREIR